MVEVFSLFLILMVAVVLLVIFANRIKIAYPIILVVSGLLISLIPGLPPIKVEPELIFIIFLPPLLFEAATAISWKELWKWKRIIFSFAFVVVAMTAVSVALVANYFVPGFSLALGFLLGAIVSPPDAVSVGAILKFVKVPHWMATILEGESLFNDASALIIFRFSMVAVATGQFAWSDVPLSFSWMVLGGSMIGLAIGWFFIQLHKRLPTDDNMDLVLTLVAPYLMYIVAEEVHSSGVMAVVCGGLLFANSGTGFLSSSSRLKSISVWEAIAFLLNGLVFLLIGLDLPEIIEGMNGIPLNTAVGYGLLITGTLILVRIFAAYLALLSTYITQKYIVRNEWRNPGIQTPLVIGWAGMRGVVSLASALSIPVHLDNGAAFPQRNLILFITFVVILVTLLAQGLTLPVLIRKVAFPEPENHLSPEEAEQWVKTGLARAGIDFLQTKYPDELHNHAMIKQLAAAVRQPIDAEQKGYRFEDFSHIYLELYEIQRQWLKDKNNTHNIDDHIIRKYFRYLDMEEDRLRFM